MKKKSCLYISRLVLISCILFICILTIACAPDIEKLKSKGDVDGLLKALNYKPGNTGAEEKKIREEAFIALKEVINESNIDQLIRIVENKEREYSTQTRIFATLLLEELGTDQVLEPILIALQDRTTYGSYWKSNDYFGELTSGLQKIEIKR